MTFKHSLPKVLGPLADSRPEILLRLTALQHIAVGVAYHSMVLLPSLLGLPI